MSPSTSIQEFESAAAAGPVRLARAEVWACRVPLETPVETSFGAMRDRPAVFVRLEDSDGAFGFGEAWCNFPGCGAEHRARLIAEEIAPLAFTATYRQPAELFRSLSEKVRVRVIQTGEPGPYSQAIAGLDIALWDLFARKAGLPLCRLLNPQAGDAVPAYASGIHIARAAEVLPQARSEGYRAFKVKVGFDRDRDIEAVNRLAEGLAPGERLFADANQAWDAKEALRFLEGIGDSGLGWLEEPLPADAPAADWKRLAGAGRIPLAAGENITGLHDFSAAIEDGALAFIQPDAAKWGGVTGCFAVARQALAAGRTYCPHYLGGGIGLIGSAHLLAAAGGEGLLEIDYNDNPLREEIWAPVIEDGCAKLTDAHGLGIDALPGGIVWRASYCRDLRPGKQG